jgi:phage terminase small subunit
MGKLTEKQKRFIDYYIETGNATEAARRAGYSEKTAAETGYENLRKPNIKNYIDKRLKQLKDERIAKADEVLQYLTAVMRGEEKEKFIIFNDDGEKVEVEAPAKIKERTKAAELLGKRYTLFADKLDIEGTIDTGTEKLDSILKQLKED